MSMQGLADIPATEVLPTCSIPIIKFPIASSISTFIFSNADCHATSYGSTTTFLILISFILQTEIYLRALSWKHYIAFFQGWQQKADAEASAFADYSCTTLSIFSFILDYLCFSAIQMPLT
jgi:hypothetical protein